MKEYTQQLCPFGVSSKQITVLYEKAYPSMHEFSTSYIQSLLYHGALRDQTAFLEMWDGFVI